ncbi:FAA hydrolase domain containing protein [Asbolus verrucosus]|uniref:FAA hydrolase domain containing protein n=1 Tax=Asbolus verrucosus TaxID=1661398 RepID=A0A482VM42_ASBVE|nr:FAA hydrolase domain containing protein [Asbolus verrucosus]
MRIVQFRTEKDLFPSRIGVLQNDVIADCTNEGLPNTLIELLSQNNSLQTLARVAPKAAKVYPASSVRLMAPVTKPDKILCVGMNYKEHCNELNMPYPLEPIIFSKFASTIVGPGDNIIKPSCSEALDWEVELVVVIGKEGKQIKIEDAYDYILGYTVGQDLTARDWVTKEKNGGQFLLGKSMDTFCPLGPCVVTKDEISDPHGLRLKTWVNGTLKQNGSTSEMVHRIDKLISYLSSLMTLYPGDLIMTGTPSGVGFFRTPPEALRPGDLVESEIEKIGRLSNRVF